MIIEIGKKRTGPVKYSYEVHFEDGPNKGSEIWQSRDAELPEMPEEGDRVRIIAIPQRPSDDVRWLDNFTECTYRVKTVEGNCLRLMVEN